jgi:hypothetical protein
LKNSRAFLNQKMESKIKKARRIYGPMTCLAKNDGQDQIASQCAW